MKPPSRTRIPSNVPRSFTFEFVVMMNHKTTSLESITAARHNRVPYRGGTAAGDLKFTLTGMVSTSGEGRRKGGGRRRSDGGVSETSGVVMMRGRVKEREDPRTGASGAEYTEHG
jgi:hypothetical protein